MSDSFDLSSAARRIVLARRLALVALLFGLLGLIYDTLRDVEPLYRATATIQMEIKGIEEASIISVEALDRKDVETVERLNTLAATTPNTALIRGLVAHHDLLNHPQFATIEGADASEGRLVQKLQTAVQAAVREGTHLVDISVSHSSPELVVDLVNWVAEGIIRQDAERKFAAVQEPYTVLTNVADSLRIRLDHAETALAAFRKKEGLAVSLEEHWEQLTRKQEALVDQRYKIDAQIAQRESDLAVLANLDKPSSLEQLQGVLSIYNSREVARIRNLIAKHNEALELAGDEQEELLVSHTKVAAALRLRLGQAVRNAPSMLSSELERLKAQAEGVRAASERVEAEMLELVAQQVEYNVLARDIGARKTLYESALDRVKVFDLIRGLTDFPLVIVQRANGSIDVSRETSRVRSASMILLVCAVGVFVFDLLRPAVLKTETA